MTSIHYEATYLAPAERVMGVLTDEAFLAAYAQEVGALAHRVEVERAAPKTAAPFQVRTRVEMTVPTAGVPAAFKRLVTPTVDITEVRTWVAPTDGRWHGRLSVDASARGRAARVRGKLVLEPGQNGSSAAASRFGVDGDVSVAVPLIGELAAGLVKDLVGSVIRRQSTVMERWLQEA
jgi:hypothetical protein